MVFAPEQTSDVIAQYPFFSPYRVVVITDNLNDLVNSTLVENLNPPSILSDESWINPGKAAWSWWSEERSPQWLLRQKDYIDFAARHGWEYVVVDAGWDESWVDELCNYAQSLNVGIIVWTDVGALDTVQKADDLLTLWSSWGVRGVKVDFMMNDSQYRMLTYQIIAEKAAELELLVNFHGSTKPAGEIRTWPHVITTEGVRGSEHYKWSDFTTAYQNCTLPFTRNVVGPMDFTPTVISNANLNTTHEHQLALSVVFESGIQHFADSIDSYEPWSGTSFLDVVPVTWDETIVLEGFPGNFVSMARRSGDDWYVGSITNAARTAIIDCSFLPGGNYTAYIYKDGADANTIITTSQTVNSQSVLSIPLLATGGCSVLITQQPFDNAVNDDATFTYYEAEASGNTISGGAVVSGCANASGGQYVGYLGGAASSSIKGSVQFNNIVAPSSGTYELKLFYSSLHNRSFDISINGQYIGNYSAYISGSFDTIRTMSFRVSLEQGINTIQLSCSNDYAPNLDRIGIKQMIYGTEYHFEAESAANTLSGGASITSAPAASEGAKVGYIGGSGILTFNNLNVNQAGNYIIRIFYLSGDNRMLYLSVNNGALQPVLCFDSGGWLNVEYKEALIYLNQGNNVIEMSNTGGYAPDIDKIVLIEY